MVNNSFRLLNCAAAFAVVCMCQSIKGVEYDWDRQRQVRERIYLADQLPASEKRVALEALLEECGVTLTELMSWSVSQRQCGRLTLLGR